MEGLVRTRKQSDRARSTHQLESADRGTGQDTEGIRLSKGHSPTGERKWRDKSGHGKQSDRPRGTHQLESADGGTGQDTERTRVSEGHSPTRERRQRDSSGHRKNPSKRGVLTAWRVQMD
jgi:hypothetical protein